MAEIFNKIVEEVELAANELQALVSSALFSTGESNSDVGGDSGSSIPDFDLSDKDLDSMSEEQLQEIQHMLQEQLMENNPLQGIAEGVTRDIMAGQVRRFQTGKVGFQLRRMVVQSPSFQILPR